MKYVVLGASASAINGVKEIRNNDKNAEIVLISKDENIYSRCILHHYLADKRNVEQLNFAEQDFEQKQNVQWLKGSAVTNVDTDKKVVSLENNQEVYYDKLLVATGARPCFPPIKNINEVSNIYGFRNLDDIENIKEKSKTAKNIVVLGAGLVGLDVVVGLCEAGISNITLVEFADRLLNRQLDKKASSVYEEALKQHNVELVFNTACNEVNSDDNNQVQSLVLSNGETIPCDLLIVSIGVKSNVEFLEGTDVELDKLGVVVDATGKTTNEDVYAAGDVTGKGPIWPVAVKEGIVAGSNMTGVKASMDDFFYSKSTMNFFGINTMSIGINEKPDETYVEEIEENEKAYKRIIHKDGILVGAILQGDLSYGGILTQLISRKININKVNKSVFKIDYSDFFHIDENAEYYY